jgi:hypothetical protein
MYGLALGGGFAYLRFGFADPPRQVYWGNASPKQHEYLAELFHAEYTEHENRSFKYTWKKTQQALEAGIPPILGPLDMFYLPYYQSLYHQRHIPIHYVLLVGKDEGKAYVLDTELDEVQAVPIDELERAWEVNVPGLGKRNRLVTLNIPEQIAPVEYLIRKSIRDECRVMLNPPVSMLGIPAMEKVSREITHWPAELGEDTAEHCLQQVREYLNSPPDIEGNHITAGRDLYITFLEQAADLASLDFSEAIHQLRLAMEVLPRIAKAIQEKNLSAASACFTTIAEMEKKAYIVLMNCVNEPALMG